MKDEPKVGARRGSRWKWIGLALLSVVCSSTLVLVLSPWIFAPEPFPVTGPDLTADVRGQLNYFYWIIEDPERRAAAMDELRRQNPEWTCIAPAFLGYGLANIALACPQERERALRCMDVLIGELLRTPWRDYLLPYGRDREFVRKPQSSIMVDGEIALLIGLRRLVRDDPEFPYRDAHRRLVRRCIEAIEASPVLCAESYPDECWLFCNPLALAAIKVSDVVEGEDHTDLFQRWERVACAKLIEPKTGLLYSAVTLDGRMLQPPEGSSLWVAVYGLKPVLPDLARQEYDLQRQKLAGRVGAWSFGREGPVGIEGEFDIDSGFTPFGMGPASTGFAMLDAKEYGDREFLGGLMRFVELIGVPKVEDGRKRYLASNFVGDVVFFLGKTTGPAWREVERRSAAKGGAR